MGGDADFVAFVDAHSRSLFRTAFLLTGSRHSAEELLQDTLALLYPKWERVRAADSPPAYVRRSLTNRFVSSQRSPAAGDVAMWELPDQADSRDLAAAVVDRGYLWQLLGTLPERQRAALVMRYFHDLTDGEIAAGIGCRAATVRSLISRGVAAMRAQSLAGQAAIPSSNGGQS
jgi:RNA polymerase sigma-70 factor (sigma-E family)